MSSISSISLSGMNAAQTAQCASAFNTANFDTDGFRSQRVEQTLAAPAGVRATLVPTQVPSDAIVADMVDLLQANNAFVANLAVFKTSARMAVMLFRRYRVSN